VWLVPGLAFTEHVNGSTSALAASVPLPTSSGLQAYGGQTSERWKRYSSDIKDGRLLTALYDLRPLVTLLNETSSEHGAPKPPPQR